MVNLVASPFAYLFGGPGWPFGHAHDEHDCDDEDPSPVAAGALEWTQDAFQEQAWDFGPGEDDDEIDFDADDEDEDDDDDDGQ